MTRDTWTVMKKEWREYASTWSNRLSAAAVIVVLVGFLGIGFPWQVGSEWVTAGIGLIVPLWVGLTMALSITVDSFAGERERHTLESLLATRLPDRAIILGKLGAIVILAWLVTLTFAIIGLITVNLMGAESQLLLFEPDVGVAALVLGTLVLMLVATVGVFVSMRATSVNQASQLMFVGLFAIGFGIFFGAQLLPSNLVDAVIEKFSTIGITVTVVVVAGILAILDAGLLTMVMSRFRRTRLIQ